MAGLHCRRGMLALQQQQQQQDKLFQQQQQQEQKVTVDWHLYLRRLLAVQFHRVRCVRCLLSNTRHWVHCWASAPLSAHSSSMINLLMRALLCNLLHLQSSQVMAARITQTTTVTIILPRQTCYPFQDPVAASMSVVVKQEQRNDFPHVCVHARLSAVTTLPWAIRKGMRGVMVAMMVCKTSAFLCLPNRCCSRRQPQQY